MKPLRRRHKCTYCGLSVLNNCTTSPYACHHCGQRDFESKVITVVDYYAEDDKTGQDEPFEGLDWSQFSGD